MATEKRNLKSDTIALNARRFPWTREDAAAILLAIAKVETASNELASVCRDLPDGDVVDADGWAKRSRRRMIRNALECIAETNDISHAIYSKYPDLAPEDLRGHYNA